MKEKIDVIGKCENILKSISKIETIDGYKADIEKEREELQHSVNLFVKDLLCPFCGHDVRWTNRGYQTAIYCVNCGLSGPHGDDSNDGLKKWIELFGEKGNKNEN